MYLTIQNYYILTEEISKRTVHAYLCGLASYLRILKSQPNKCDILNIFNQFKVLQGYELKAKHLMIYFPVKL